MCSAHDETGPVDRVECVGLFLFRIDCRLGSVLVRVRGVDLEIQSLSDLTGVRPALPGHFIKEMEMKLIFCKDCEDVVRLKEKRRYCSCGNIWGQYVDNLNAKISHKAIPFGFANSSFADALWAEDADKRKGTSKEQGHRFEAFMIPHDCGTVEVVDEEDELEYDVKVSSVPVDGRKMIAIIRCFREYTCAGLKEAKRAYDVVKSGQAVAVGAYTSPNFCYLDKQKAEKFAAALRDLDVDAQAMYV